jgi:hypothetical protein
VEVNLGDLHLHGSHLCASAGSRLYSIWLLLMEFLLCFIPMHSCSHTHIYLCI